MAEFASDAIEVFHDRVEAALARASAAPTASSSPPVHWETITQQIVSRLKPAQDSMNQAMLRVLQHPTEVAAKLGIGPAIAHTLLRTITDATNKETAIAPWSNEAAWIDALELAARYRAAAGADGYVDRPGSRGSIVSEALKRMQGCASNVPFCPRNGL